MAFLLLFLSAHHRTHDLKAWCCAGFFYVCVMPTFPSCTRWLTPHRPDPVLRTACPNIVVSRRMSKAPSPSIIALPTPRNCRGHRSASDLKAGMPRPARYFAAAGNAGSLSMSRGSCWMIDRRLEVLRDLLEPVERRERVARD